MSKVTLYLALNQLWRILSGPIVLLVIPIFLAPMEQGIWYLFTSSAAMSAFIDLGATNLALTFAAHEKASQEKYSYYAAFNGFLKQWTTRAIIIASPPIYLLGLLIFHYSQISVVDYFIPWFFYLFGSVILFKINVNLSKFDGLGLIAHSTLCRLAMNISYTAVLIALLNFGFAINSLIIAMFLQCAVGIIITYYIEIIVNRTFLTIKQLRKDFYPEFVPLVKKFSISIISGYAASTGLIPLCGILYGALEAGKIGFGLSIFSAIYSVATIWQKEYLPTLTRFVSLNQPAKAVYYRDLIKSRSILTITIIFLVVLVAIKIPAIDKHFEERLPSIINILFIILTSYLHIYTDVTAAYMRAFKIEPLAKISVMVGLCGFCVSMISYVVAIDASMYLFGYLVAAILGVILINNKCRSLNLNPPSSKS